MARCTNETVEPVDTYVGLQIRMRRKALGWTQKELADAMGLSFQQVQKYEVGANRIAASTLARCATALSCQPGDFFPGTGDVHAEIKPLSFLADTPGGAELEALYRHLLPD